MTKLREADKIDIMRIAATPDLETERRHPDEPAVGPSPVVADEFAGFQPVGGLVHDVRRRAVAADPLGGTTVSGSIADRLARPPAGSSLPAEINTNFGAQLGTDFSDVRVHADSSADHLARSVAATAFTVGSDIYFSRGSYSPTSESGRHLLAHELTHVMQNRQAPSTGAASAPTIGRVDDPAERHAERVASDVMQALRRRAAVGTASAEAVVEANRTAPADAFRRLQRRQAGHSRSNTPSQTNTGIPPVSIALRRPVVRRMTLAAATVAQDEKKPVWVRDKGDRWVPGRIRQLVPDDKALVELADTTTVTASLVDIHDAPPPEAASKDDTKQLAVWSQPAELTGTDRAASTSPQVLELLMRLSALAQANNWDNMRNLLFVTHSGKGAPVDAVIRGVKSVIDMLRTAPSTPKPSQPLLLTAPPKLDPDRALSALPFAANEIAALNRLPQIKTPTDLAQLAATGRSAQELTIMARLAVVRDVEDLAAVASSSFIIARLMTLGAFSQVHTSTDLLQLAGTATTEADLSKLATISQATQYTDLASLVSLVAVRSVDDMVAIGRLAFVEDFHDLYALAASSVATSRLTLLSGFKQVQTRSDLLQVAGTKVNDSDLKKLADITQATDCTELISLVSLASHSKPRPIDDIVAIAQLDQLNKSIKNLTVAEIADIAASARTMKVLQELAKMKLLKVGTDLALLAKSGLSVDRLTACAGFTQVSQATELVEIAGWPEKAADLRPLTAITQATDFAHLRDLHSLVNASHPIALIVGISKLTKAATVANITTMVATNRTLPELKQLDSLNLVTNAQELVTLATLPAGVASVITLAPKATTLAELHVLAGLVTGTRTAADVLSVAESGSATFTAPTVAEIVQLFALPKTAAQISELSTAAGVTNTQQLIALANRTSTKEMAGNQWFAIENRSDKAKNEWLKLWPLTAVFAALEVGRKSALTKSQKVGDAAGQLQAYTMAFAKLTADLDLVDQMKPIVEKGAAALAAAETQLSALARPLAIIDSQLLPYYPGASPARKAIETQRAAIVKAQTALEKEKKDILADKERYAKLAALTVTVVDAARAAQDAHALAVAAVTPPEKIDGPMVFRDKKLVFQQLQPSAVPGKSTYQEIVADVLPAKTRPMWEFELADNPIDDRKGIFIRSHMTSRASKKETALERPGDRRPIPKGIVEPKPVAVRPEADNKSLSTDSLRDAPTRMLDRIGRLLIDSMEKLSKYRTPHISLTIVGQQVLIAGNTAANKTQVLSATNTLKELRSQSPKTAGDRKIKALIDGDYQHDHRLEARRAAKVPDGAPDPEQVTDVLARLEIIRKAILTGDLVWKPDPVEPPVKKEKKAKAVAETPVATRPERIETDREKKARLEKAAKQLKEEKDRRAKARISGIAISNGKVHGEMELLNNVKSQMKNNKGDPAKLKDWPYGGVKRDCLACHRAFAIFNEKVAKQLGYRVVTAGTHSKLYPGWRAPTWLVEIPNWPALMAKPNLDPGWEFIGPVLEPPLDVDVVIPVEPEDLPYESDSDREDDD